MDLGPIPGSEPLSSETAGGAVPGRCIFCDQRCDVSAIYHEYCREAYEQEQAGYVYDGGLLRAKPGG
jgi:hypothetical protein